MPATVPGPGVVVELIEAPPRRGPCRSLAGAAERSSSSSAMTSRARRSSAGRSPYLVSSKTRAARSSRSREREGSRGRWRRSRGPWRRVLRRRSPARTARGERAHRSRPPRCPSRPRASCLGQLAVVGGRPAGPRRRPRPAGRRTPGWRAAGTARTRRGRPAGEQDQGHDRVEPTVAALASRTPSEQVLHPPPETLAARVGTRGGTAPPATSRGPSRGRGPARSSAARWRSEGNGRPGRRGERLVEQLDVVALLAEPLVVVLQRRHAAR